MSEREIVPIEPDKVVIAGVKIIKRDVFYDPRGFLIENFDEAKEGDKSVYSYASLTHPGDARDSDRFHVHFKQQDRFTVVLGRMYILVFDNRENSPTLGKLQVIEANGGGSEIKEKISIPCYTITIPEGVYHGVMNPGPGIAMLVNHPTERYNPKDEGRIPFSDTPIPSKNNETFNWEKVKR